MTLISKNRWLFFIQKKKNNYVWPIDSHTYLHFPNGISYYSFLYRQRKIESYFSSESPCAYVGEATAFLLIGSKKKKEHILNKISRNCLRHQCLYHLNIHHMYWGVVWYKNYRIHLTMITYYIFLSQYTT